MPLHLLSIHDAGTTASEGPQPGPSAYAMATLCWMLSAGVYIAAKWAEADMPPWALAFWRPALAGLLLLPALHGHAGEIRALLSTRWLEVLLIGAVGLSLSQGCIYSGLQAATAVTAGLIMALAPIVTMLLARFMLGESMNAWQALGAATALVGMLVIVAHGDLATLMALQFGAGEIWLVAAAVLFALYSVLLRRARFPLPPMPLLLVLLVAGALAALPFYAWEMMRGALVHLNTPGLLALAYVAIPGGALMYLLYNRSLDTFGAAKAGVFVYLQPIFVAVMANALLGERIEAYHAEGAALIVAGVLLVTLLKSHHA
jgi:drug/metabolite transporter (DMT)-like permease